MTTSSNTANDHCSKSIKLENTTPTVPYSSFLNVTNTAYDTPKRTRFSFKQEHLLVKSLLFVSVEKSLIKNIKYKKILEKCFIENQYPDQKKRRIS